jgi:hypothetical protein
LQKADLLLLLISPILSVGVIVFLFLLALLLAAAPQPAAEEQRAPILHATFLKCVLQLELGRAAMHAHMPARLFVCPG